MQRSCCGVAPKGEDACNAQFLLSAFPISAFCPPLSASATTATTATIETPETTATIETCPSQPPQAKQDNCNAISAFQISAFYFLLSTFSFLLSTFLTFPLPQLTVFWYLYSVIAGGIDAAE
jgi:hypothetical protein